MSLHQLAHHVQSAGRGDDKVLVHMTPKEVGGLQALAMAHGGSLTVNPETGLPEASFLSRLLPMIAGFALGPAGFGLTAMQAGLATAAVGTATTGSLGKGLMMGLGAYGGAGLGAGLSSMGTTTPTAAVPSMNVATTGVEGMKSGMYGGQGVFSQGIPTSTAATTGSATTGVTPVGGLTGYTAYTPPKPYFDIGSSMQRAGMLPPATPAPVASGVPNASFNISNYSPAGMGASPTTIRPTLPSEATVDVAGSVPQTAFDKLGTGFKKATGSAQGLKDLYAASEAAAPYATYAGLGSYALGSYYDKLDKAKGPPKDSSGMIRPYTYERSQNLEAYDMGKPIYAEPPGSSRERNYFNEAYTALTPYKAPGPEYAASGGLMGMAVGGPVEAMSAANAIGNNTMYPQSQFSTPMYSNPMMQRPVDTPVVTQGYDTPVDPYTGEQKFGIGGKVATATATAQPQGGYSYSYDPNTMQFTQAGTPTSRRPSESSHWLGNVINKLASITNPQPAVDHGAKVSGGIAPPAMGPAPAMPAQPVYIAPSPPAYQSPEQQLGASAVYPMMEDRLASLGAAQGYAAGGGISRLRPEAMNKRMAAVDTAQAKMQSRQGQAEIEKAARSGDRSALLALQQAGYDLNDLNQYAAGGGISHLGDYSDGGRLLKGPGDGVSDSIPAVIGNRQPARLADGEFVVPARIVSELGNGSTEAGARKLYAMMDRIQKARRKTVGKNRVAANTKSEKYLPA